MHFSFRKHLIVIALTGTCVPALSDLIPLAVAEAQSRLRANPDTFDLADQFCTGRKRGDSCLVSGNAFEGGGPGVCDAFARDKILLKCVVRSEVIVDRQIPDGGFVTSDSACREYRSAVAQGRTPAARPFECDPPANPLTDRFCRGLGVGSACTAEMRVDGRREEHGGSCKSVEEYKYARAYGGRPMPTRTVLKCEPAKFVEHVYSPASWLDKLRQ